MFDFFFLGAVGVEELLQSPPIGDQGEYVVIVLGLPEMFIMLCVLLASAVIINLMYTRSVHTTHQISNRLRFLFYTRTFPMARTNFRPNHVQIRMQIL